MDKRSALHPRDSGQYVPGSPGTGKTGLAMGLLREACLNGYRGRFYNAQVLLDELYASLADRTTTKLLAQMSRMRPLLIDELGYLTLRPEQANAFFRLMDQRYNRVSTIITTNLDLPDWYDLFDKKPLVDALLDRLQVAEPRRSGRPRCKRGKSPGIAAFFSCADSASWTLCIMCRRRPPFPR
jgi:DNA replication protein DnaC